MADKNIAALTAASALAGADLFHISQGGNSRKATMTQLLTLTGTGFYTSTAVDALLATYQPLTPRVQSVVSAATVTPTASNDAVVITAQAAALTIANPTGSPVEMQGLVIRIKDNATARAITYGNKFRAMGTTLPTTTVLSKTTYLAFVYNAADDKWDCLAVGQEA